MTLVGADDLQRRLAAIRSDAGDRAMMQMVGRAVANQAIKTVHKRTGNLARSISVEAVSDDSVTITAKAAYARYEEEGTPGGQLIVPVRAKALRFAATAAGQRLSGSARRGAAVVFRKSVRRGATPAHPYLVPSARDVIHRGGLIVDNIIVRWNRAA